MRKTPTERQMVFLRWLKDNEGANPGKRFSPSLLTLVRAGGWAEPNCPSTRPYQFDAWWLTDKGQALFD